jgi:regulation of enolase protein 1 (concanavalin A-like superfamily)
MRKTLIVLGCSTILWLGLAGVCDAGLVGYWPLDEGSGGQALDSTGNNHNGAINGATWVTPGWNGEGACLQFDGVDDRVEVPNAADLRFGTNTRYTLAAWVNWTVLPGHWSGVVTKGREVGNWYGIWLDPSNAWVFGHGGNNQVGSVTTATVWIHVAMVYDNGNKKIYLNGKLDNETTSSQNGDNTGDLWFGAAKGVTEFAPTKIDDIRIYDQALTAQEIKALIPPKLKAFDPIPANGAVSVSTPLLQWTKGETAVFHNVYLGTTPELTEANLVAPRQPFAVFYYMQGFQPGTTYYWRVDEIEAGGTIHTGNVWSFTTEPLTAYLPQPADGAANLFPGPTLTWLPGKGAVKHQVYFSSVSSDVEGRTAAADRGTTANTEFSPGSLRASTTYYWRVDEILTDGTTSPGPVWSFTTADGVTQKIVRQWWTGIAGTAVSALTGSPDYPNNPTGTELIGTFEGPTDWADNYGTRMYGWLTPPQSGDFTFWIASDDNGELWLSTDADPANGVVIARVSDWTNSQEWTKFTSQKSAAIPLQAGQKYFIQVLQKEGGGGDNVAVSWQGPGLAAQAVIKAEYVDTFALPPLTAFSPSPANGAVDTPQAGALSWSAGEKAQKHEVYFGNDKAAVAAADNASPLFKGSQAGTSFSAGDLEWGKTYYWRVDEINAGEADSPWKGPVWSFTTAGFIPVDDMESYTDDEGSRIYETWVDGWTNGTGAVVGNLQAPFAEQTIIHGGKQAMPLDYNNIKSPFYSEAEQTFAPLQNWATNGVDTLSLWFRGNPVSFADKGNGALTVSGSGNDIWNTADAFRFAYKRLNGNGWITARVDSQTNTDGWAKAGVMIRETLEADSTHAMVIVTPSNGVSFQRRPVTAGASANTDATGLTAPYWVRLTRTGNAFKAESSPDGKTWTAIGTEVNILMTANVYVGLAVTAHNPAAVSTAEFSNVATAGGVSGSWQAAAIGSDPQPGNSPAGLYVAVEDSTGKVAVATHPDPTAVLTTAWTEWKIPLSSFAGVNLAKVKTLYLGVGDRNNPVADAAGRIYIDDIRVTRP